MQHLGSKYPLGVYRFLASYMPTLASVGAFSFFINVLALSGAIYMLQVYDRVLTSMSVPTLIGLSVILVILYAISGTLEIVRARIMSRVGTELDANLSPQVFAAVVKRSVAKRDPGDGLQPVRDLDQIRGFMSGMGPIALFDLPWMPLFLIFVYLLHPMIALVAVIGMVLLLLLTLVTEVRSADPLRAAAQAGGQRLALAETVRRNSDSVQAMGFAGALSGRYQALSLNYLAEQLRASDTIGSVGNITKVVRLMLQSGVLGLGAYLVIHGELTAGGIIAASITVARALAPIEQAVTQWRGFINARQSAARLGHFLASAAVAEEQRIELPAPKNTLKVERLTLMPPGLNTPILRGVGFDLQSGDGLGIIGPSGSGKTSLGRALVGLWKAANPDGAVRLDNAALEQWDSAQLGRHIGYMPQDVELMPGTIAENISRFSPDASSEAIVKAAKTAGAHDLIVRLSDGYQTRIGEGGRMLSGGERQRVALARALYGDPFLIVLDEPNANLDSDGDAALTQAILSVRRRGGIAIVIAHRPSALAGANKVLVLTEGQVRAFGARDEILKSVMQSVPGAAAAAKTLPRSEPKEQSS